MNVVPTETITSVANVKVPAIMIGTVMETCSVCTVKALKQFLGALVNLENLTCMGKTFVMIQNSLK